jgi:hypothetical protein
MKINNAVVLLYRRLAFGVLSIFFAGVVSYVGLVLFYSVSTTWATPLVLSPSQPRVLSFQPQVALLVLNLNKQKSELKTAILTKKSILEQLINVDSMEIKLREAIEVEKNRSASTVAIINQLNARKRNNIVQSEKALAQSKELEKQINQELSAGLITSDQAAQRAITLQGALNSQTEQLISSAEMQVKSTELRDYSLTLGGSSRSLAALVTTKQLMEMSALRTQLQLQLDVGERNVEIVRSSMVADNRILQVAMNSPYYRALWASTPILFIPYDNLSKAEPGAAIYDCILQVLLCRQVGTIDKVFEAEEYARHPLFKSDLKGRFATINLTDKNASNSLVLFMGSKPLFI